MDLDGKVIGINTMKAATADGISFAIPIDVAWAVVRQLLQHGRVARPSFPPRGRSEDGSRRRRGRDAEYPWRRAAATPRPRR